MENWKPGYPKGIWNGFGRELDAWQWSDRQVGEYGSIKWSGIAWSKRTGDDDCN